MRKRAFTLVEIIVVVVIVGILATIGLPLYQNIMESSKQKVCDTNLLTLKKAVELYTMDHDIVPAALSQLNDKYIEKAYARAMSGKGAWERRLAYLLVEGPQWGLAYAQSFGMPKLRCPCNQDSSATSISYGISSGVAGQSAFNYTAFPGSTVIVSDSGADVFTCSSIKSDIKENRAHKKYRIIGPCQLFFRGITKDENKGAYDSNAAFVYDNY